MIPAVQVQPVVASAKWPDVNMELREAVIRDHGGLADLWELSRPRIEDNAQHTEFVIDRLFPGNPLICAGRNHYRFDTKPRSEWRGGLLERQFIVPSPMIAIRGKTQTGAWSKHTLDNTGPRRFLICEFDEGTLDDHAALLMQPRIFSFMHQRRSPRLMPAR